MNKVNNKLKNEELAYIIKKTGISLCLLNYIESNMYNLDMEMTHEEYLKTILSISLKYMNVKYLNFMRPNNMKTDYYELSLDDLIVAEASKIPQKSKDCFYEKLKILK